MSDKPKTGDDSVDVVHQDGEQVPVEVAGNSAAAEAAAGDLQEEPVEASESVADEAPVDIAPADPMAELLAQLAKAQADQKDTYNRLLRTVADMDNLRKRTKKDVEEARIDARIRVLREVLPVIDNLERAVEHAEAGSDDGGVIEGVKLVLRQFGQALQRCEVVSLEAQGTPFDPNLHEAIAQHPTDEVAPGSVYQVFQRGYKIGDRLLRPSLVVVAQAMPADDGEDVEVEVDADSEPDVDSAVDAEHGAPTPMPPADDEVPESPKSPESSEQEG